MTLRRNHRKMSIQRQNTSTIPYLQNQSDHDFSNYPHQQQPSHPKTFIQIPWIKSKMNSDVQQARFTTNLSKAKTARQSYRGVQVIQDSVVTSRKYRDNEENYLSDSLAKVTQQHLFVPERSRINEKIVKYHNRKRVSSFTQSISHTSQKIHSSQYLQQNINPSSQQITSLHIISPNKATIHHIAHFRKYQNEQKHRQTLLTNRLNFLTIQKQRDITKMEILKRKYHNVISIREDCLKQKQTITKRKLSNYLQDLSHKHKKISAIRQQQSQRKLSVSRLFESKSLQATRLRQQQKKIQKHLQTQKLTELQKKKSLVNNHHALLQKGHEKRSQTHRSRISNIRSIQNKNLVRNYANAGKKEKINEKLYQTLQKQMKLINEHKLKTTEELKEYQNFLGLNGKQGLDIVLNSKGKGKTQRNNVSNGKTNQSKMVGSRTQSTSGSRSFYLTHY